MPSPVAKQGLRCPLIVVLFAMLKSNVEVSSTSREQDMCPCFNFCLRDWKNALGRVSWANGHARDSWAWYAVVPETSTYLADYYFAQKCCSEDVWTETRWLSSTVGLPRRVVTQRHVLRPLPVSGRGNDVRRGAAEWACSCHVLESGESTAWLPDSWIHFSLGFIPIYFVSRHRITSLRRWVGMSIWDALKPLLVTGVSTDESCTSFWMPVYHETIQSITWRICHWMYAGIWLTRRISRRTDQDLEEFNH